MKIITKIILSILLGVALFFLITALILMILNETKPANFSEPNWNVDNGFYVVKKPEFLTGDYVFFYFSEFKDNPKTYCIFGQRMSTNVILNDVEVDFKKIDNQTYTHNLVFWYYDGKEIHQKTTETINHIGEDNLTAKGDNSEFVLQGNYPSYRFSYTDPEFKIIAILPDAGLTSLKTFEINEEGSQQKILENESMNVVKTSLDGTFKYYNGSKRLLDLGKGGYSLVHFTDGKYLNTLLQDLFVPVEATVNEDNMSGVLYMESVWGRGGLPVEWVLLSTWFKDGSHSWFFYYPDMWPFNPSYNRTLHMWFYDAKLQKMHLFDRFHWKEINENGSIRFVLEGENTVENTRVEVAVKVLAAQTNIFWKKPFFLHKYTYKQMPSTLESFNFYSQEYNKTLEEMGPSASYTEKASLYGFNLKKEYSN